LKKKIILIQFHQFMKYRHDITEILLKVVLSTTILTPYYEVMNIYA